MNGQMDAMAGFGEARIPRHEWQPLFGFGSVAALCQKAGTRKQRICATQGLTGLQRRTALELLVRRTEDELAQVLGPREYHAFKNFNAWWFRDLASSPSPPCK